MNKVSRQEKIKIHEKKTDELKKSEWISEEKRDERDARG